MEHWRQEFPILADRVYLQNNALGATPRGIKRMLDRYAEELWSHGEAGWKIWYPWVLEAADRAGRLIGAPPGSVTLDSGVTEFVHRFASALSFKGTRRRVVCSELDFPSIGYAWQGWARHGAELVVVPSPDGVVAPPETFYDAIDERTLVVSLSLATYCSGALLDIKAIARRAHEVGALVLVDAFQAFGVVPIDVIDLDVDVLISGTRKFAMGSGESAFMYVRRELIPTLEPVMVGWSAHRDPMAFAPDFEYAPDARRFAMGTPLILPHYVASVGWDILEEIGLDRIREQSLRLTSRVIEHADDMGLEVATPRSGHERGGIVCLKFPGAAEVTAALNQRGFCCSYRPASGLRVGPHFYNTIDEVDRFMEALSSVRKDVPV